MNTFLLSLRNFILFIFCCVVISGIVFGSGHYPESGCDPDCPPCPATSGDPVILVRGSVKESVTDLSINEPLGGWRHSRDYDSMLDTRTYNNPNYNIQGRRWTGGAQSIYLRRNGNTMELYLSASSKRVFTDNDPGKVNGTYTAPSDFNATLTKSVAIS